MNHHSFPSYHSHLAQIPTDQRELEYNRLPVQTTGAEGTLPASALQPYGSPVTNWATSRSSLALQSMLHHHPQYSDFWGVTTPGHFEQLAGSHLPRNFVSDNSACSSFYTPSSNPATMDSSSASMNYFRQRELRDQSIRAMQYYRNVKNEDDDSVPGYQDLSPPSSQHWMGQLGYSHHPIKMEDPDGISHYISTASSSPTSTSSRYPSAATTSMTADDSPRTSSSGEEDPPTDPPYSQLIYQALRESKDCKLQLQDIYSWFEKNTSKGKEPGKGWQNSIRHNLSMNAGFVAIRTENSNGGKRPVNYWCLTSEAIRKGKVESTTRYRRPMPTRTKKPQSEPSRRHGPQRARQQASSKSSDLHRPKQGERHLPELHHPQATPQIPTETSYPASGIPPYQVAPMGSGGGVTPVNQLLYFDYSSVTGLADDPHGGDSIFCELTDGGPHWEGTMQMRQRF